MPLISQKLTVPTTHVVSVTCLQDAIRSAMAHAKFTVTVPVGCVARLDVQIHWSDGDEYLPVRDILYWTTVELMFPRHRLASSQAFRYFNMPNDQIVVTVTVTEG